MFQVGKKFSLLSLFNSPPPSLPLVKKIKHSPSPFPREENQAFPSFSPSLPFNTFLPQNQAFPIFPFPSLLSYLLLFLFSFFLPSPSPSFLFCFLPQQLHTFPPPPPRGGEILNFIHPVKKYPPQTKQIIINRLY